MSFTAINSDSPTNPNLCYNISPYPQLFSQSTILFFKSQLYDNHSIKQTHIQKSYLNQIIMKILLTLLLTLSCILTAQSSNMYKLQLLSTDRGARCLDGSPYGLYIHQGSEQNKGKVMIYMNSGGFCEGFTLEQSLESCYKRTRGSLGSTKNAPLQRNFDKQGLLSTDPIANPVFYDWTKVYAIYCDGSEYTGSKKNPVAYKDIQLYFRGYNNVIEMFRYLDEQLDFYNGEKIVLTGVSAGGMGTYFYSNYLYENTKSAKVYAIPDSGLFLVDFFSPLAGTQILRKAAEPLLQLVNEGTSGFPIPACIQANPNDIIECYTTSNLTQYFKAPMLIIESPYDAYSIQNAVYTQCLGNGEPPYSLEKCDEKTREVIEDYRNRTIGAIRALKKERKDVGIWAPSCVQHGFTDCPTFTDQRFRVPSGSGVMVSEAIREFLDNPQNAPVYFDQVPWPYNSGCSGMDSYRLQRA